MNWRNWRRTISGFDPETGLFSGRLAGILHRWILFLRLGVGPALSFQVSQSSFPGCGSLAASTWNPGWSLPGSGCPLLNSRCIPYESELDGIGAFDVLEHIEEDEAVLRQIYKALKPGGYLYISVPQHHWLWSAVDECACHFRRYAANALHDKVRRAGFDIVRSTSFVSTLLPAMYLSRWMQRSKLDLGIDDVAGLRINPVLNTIFEWFLRFELALIQTGVSLPAGGSRLLIAMKPAMIQKDI
jgi:SAM-dependent methyltransferase